MIRQRRTQRAVWRSRRPSRRGMALVLVLGLLAIAMATAYAMVRTRSTSVHLQVNLQRRVMARQAALSGISAALRAIHQADWQGVDVPLERSLSRREAFRVEFETGDPNLTSGDPLFAEYPYRLTITSTGYAMEPADPQSVVRYRIRVVVRLIRRQLSTPPAEWPEITRHTVYQWSDDSTSIQLPARIVGSVRLSGGLKLATEYPSDAAARQRYLADLERMRQAGLGDLRPLTGPVYLPQSRTPALDWLLVQSALNVRLYNAEPSSIPKGSVPVGAEYQLYPGGQRYAAPVIQKELGSTLRDVRLGPDLIRNPLGVFLTIGNLDLLDNVSIRGTLIGLSSKGDIHIKGNGVRLEAVNLPPLEGSSAAVQLPVLIHADDVEVLGCRDCIARGMIVVGDRFEARPEDGTSMTLVGRLVTRKLTLGGRPAWKLSKTRWRELHQQFLVERSASPSPDSLFFPAWLKDAAGLDPKPLLTIRPESGAITYHWHNWDEPLFQPHPEDEGLRWELVDWRELSN